MRQIITHTPLYVWPLLVYLGWRGWKARKDHIVSWKFLLIMPILMTLWSIYSVITQHENITLWALSLSVGTWLGALTTRKLETSFDKEQKLIKVAGNWAPMTLSMAIFSLRYFLGASYGLYPNLAGAPMMLAIECVATIVSGMFSGRLIGYYQKSKTSPHTPLNLNV